MEKKKYDLLGEKQSELSLPFLQPPYAYSGSLKCPWLQGIPQSLILSAAPELAATHSWKPFTGTAGLLIY